MTELNIQEGLVARINDCFPSVLADPFSDLVAQLTRAQIDWDRAFVRLVDGFEISVMFLGLVSTAAYLKDRNVRKEAAADRVVLRLRGGPALTTGTWWELLRETLRTRRDAPPTCPTSTLEAVYFKKGGRVTKLQQMLDGIPNLRNKKKGHSWTLTKSTYEKLVRDNYVTFEQWLEAISFLQEFWLVDFARIEGEASKFQGEILRGSHRHYTSRIFEIADVGSAWTGHRLGLVKSREGQVRLENDDILWLHPFVVHNRSQDTDEGEVMLFVEERKGVPWYMGVRTSHTIGLRANSEDLAAAVVDPRRTLQEFLEPQVEAARKTTLDYVKSLVDSGVYRRDFYVKRNQAMEQITDFMAGDKKAMVVGGESGIGKSNLLCALADELYEADFSSVICLLFGPSDFTADQVPVERLVGAALRLDVPLESWLQRLAGESEGHEAVTLLVMVDAVDKLPSIVDALQAIDRFVYRFRDDPRVRVLVTSTLDGLALADQAGLVKDVSLYYAPARAMVGDAEGPTPVPFVPLLRFSAEDLEGAYNKYLQCDGYQPTTAFRDLQLRALDTLRHPLFLRLTMSAYNAQPVPAQPISNRTLNRYCTQNILGSRATSQFVNELVDLMLERASHKVSAEEVCTNPLLREGYLSSALDAPFETLRRNQTLTLTRDRECEFFALMPTQYVEFGMYRVFQYLLTNRAVARYGTTPEGIAGIAQVARDFPALRSGLVDLLAGLARHGARDVFRALHDPSGDEWAEGVLADVLADMCSDDEAILSESEKAGEDEEAEGGSEGAAPGGEPQEAEEEEEEDVISEETMTRKLVEYLFDLDPEAAKRTVYRCAEALFRQGRWDGAICLLAYTEQAGDHTPNDRLALANRLVVMLKNSDKWSLAMKYSDQNEEVLRGNIEVSSQVRSRHCLNRFSVLYDKGKRDEAMRQCRQSYDIAEKNGLAVEQAAAANNLGIALVYYDKPGEAEDILLKGLAAKPEHDMLEGHLYLDLGLVRLVIAQLKGLDLSQVEADINAAAERFKRTDYAQGILYGHATIGLIRLCQSKWEEAYLKFTLGLNLANELGEKWPAYGTQANLALWYRAVPDADRAEALDYAISAYRGAKSNGDPEGEAITGMILSRVLMDSGKVAHDRYDVATLLRNTEKTMSDFKFHSAAARACAGLVELHRLQGQDPGEWMGRRDEHRKELPAAYFAPDFAETFEPMDWKLLFLAELQ